MLLVTELLRATIFAATPILLAALGGAYTYHANVFNIAMEGMMLVGAFTAVLASYFFQSWILGIAAAICGGLLSAVLFLVFVIYGRTDEFITGIAINMLALGGTTYALRQIFMVKGAFQSPLIAGIPTVRIPLINDIPIVGRIVSDLPFLVYLTALLVYGIHYYFYHTRGGLRLRAVGEAPVAIDAIGMRSARIKSIAILNSGILCGFSGAMLSLGYVTLFVENMSNGRGWIALTVIILTRGRPLAMVLIALLFGIFDGLGFVLQGINIPSQFAQMTPYVVTMIALYVYARRGKGAIAPLA